MEKVKSVKSVKTKVKTLSPLRVGNNVFIRTVTQYYTGHVAVLSPKEVILVSAAWIACTARFTQFLASGELDEVEVFPGPVLINREAIVEVTNWPHPLPCTQK